MFLAHWWPPVDDRPTIGGLPEGLAILARVKHLKCYQVDLIYSIVIASSI